MHMLFTNSTHFNPLTVRGITLHKNQIMPCKMIDSLGCWIDTNHSSAPCSLPPAPDNECAPQSSPVHAEAGESGQAPSTI